jgi:hypothetical protein
MITSNPFSALGDLKNGWPYAISKARNENANKSKATPTKTKPTNERWRRFRPRTISAPQPAQTLALSDTPVWQCGHTKAFTTRHNTLPVSEYERIFAVYFGSAIWIPVITPLSPASNP